MSSLCAFTMGKPLSFAQAAAFVSPNTAPATQRPALAAFSTLPLNARRRPGIRDSLRIFDLAFCDGAGLDGVADEHFGFVETGALTEEAAAYPIRGKGWRDLRD